MIDLVEFKAHSFGDELPGAPWVNVSSTYYVQVGRAAFQLSIWEDEEFVAMAELALLSLCCGARLNQCYGEFECQACKAVDKAQLHSSKVIVVHPSMGNYEPDEDAEPVEEEVSKRALEALLAYSRVDPLSSIMGSLELWSELCSLLSSYQETLAGAKNLRFDRLWKQNSFAAAAGYSS